ncbi:MAG: hypothetical protein WCJ66_17135, partial [Verrucomicrobiota bacterium]
PGPARLPHGRRPPAALGPTQIVLQNGVSLPLSAVVLKGENYEVKVETGRFEVGKTIPVTSVDHVFGDKPAAINQAIALVLTGKPVEGRKLLIPILAEHKDSAKLPGNFWLEAARVSLVANALEGAGPQCDSLGKEISAVSPVSPDPFVALSKALVLHKTVKLADRQAALKALVTDSQPADVCGYASFFLAGLLQEEKRDTEALEAYLAVPCLFPSGGMMLNGMAQLKAAEYLTSVDRRSEAVGLVQSALRYTKDTLGHDLANNLYQSIK